MDDKISKLIKEVATFEPKPKEGKSNHTHRLNSTNYLKLKRYCEVKKISTSTVVDRLIEMFVTGLEEQGEFVGIDFKEKDKKAV